MRVSEWVALGILTVAVFFMGFLGLTAIQNMQNEENAYIASLQNQSKGGGLLGLGGLLGFL